MTLEETREFFARDRYATVQTGITIDEVGEDYSRCSFTVNENHLAAHGHLMGGTYFTLADFAFAVATNAPGVKTFTINSSISFLSQPKDDHIIAECHKIKDGRTTCTFETNITDGTGRLLAVVINNGMHL
ncbi:MAG: PaaI family thioesterase [Lachnospiraceae bacterium]|nr:PaaI family thioesterase [Lachnospiraceae bacterium]